GTVTLTAQWNVNYADTAYWANVTYDANTADTGEVPVVQHFIGSTENTLATNSGNLAKSGYTFAGWNTQADGNGTTYAAGA
ncbi:InlB B-repeat-containing protein, partial [Streptomyces turgidiscabies]|uniref:InlB B-repeat-containing protein n=1 Tax=Streptomyces turgidiscabies TaxID=85558 RepID=UPI0038F60117